MLEASAEELSAAIQWYYWGLCAGELIKDLLQCIPILSITFLHILPTIFITLSILFLSVALISDCLYHSWLDTSSKITNPIKLIYKVLNYARKTKYPTNRSAFTYLDEEQPSRLDFGKTSLEDHSQRKRWRMSRQSCVCFLCCVLLGFTSP